MLLAGRHLHVPIEGIKHHSVHEMLFSKILRDQYFVLWLTKQSVVIIL